MGLIVPVPPKNTARIRFVDGGTNLSKQIENKTGAPISHAEAVMQDGTIVAALVDSGVQRYANDYDKTSPMQIFIDVHMPEEMYARWSDYLWGQVGSPYDQACLEGYALGFDWHTAGAWICSAIQVSGFRHCKFFENHFSLKYHQITPAILLTIMQSQPSDRVKIHTPEYLRV